MARIRVPLPRLIAGLVVLLVLLVGSVIAGLVRDDGAPSTSSSTYRIAYDVEDLRTGVHTTEVLEVDRPLVSRWLLPGGGSATAAHGVYDRTPEGQWRQLVVVGPGEPGADLQLAAPLAWAEGAGLAHRDGSGTVAGHACTWWLTREPLDVATFAPATPADRVRSCVDGSGRLLGDTWRSSGKEVRRRTATSVHAPTSVRVFDGTTPTPIDRRLITLVAEDLDSPVAELIRLTPPPGATLRTAARMLVAVPGSADLAQRVHRAVYTRGGLVVVVDQIRDYVGTVTPRGDRTVSLGTLGTGHVRATGGGLVVEVALGEGLVRVRSGLSLEELAGWLATLERVP